MTLNELTQGFLNDLVEAVADEKKKAEVRALWEKQFEEAGYGPLEWTGHGWSMNGGNRIVTEAN